MNRTEIEQAVLNEIHTLPLDKVEATLNYVLSLKKSAKPANTAPDHPCIEQVEGQRILSILKDTGFLASMPDAADLSENYKDYLDWGDKT
ncbi:hypothetical protein [Methylotuvimicrobium sp. KM2]|uniref:hypothetical protein n=1 Tax=Methylotuvimicrobium sp. KM2 TaxID=3133976 RepID=UPI0031016B94